MRIPGLSAEEQLDEAHFPFDQSAGDQVARNLVVALENLVVEVENPNRPVLNLDITV